MKTRQETAAVPEGALEDHRALTRRALRYCVGVFVALRIGLTILGLAGVALLPHPGEAVSGAAGIPGPVGAPGWPAPQITQGWHNAVTSFERFDALWFLGIATAGRSSPATRSSSEPSPRSWAATLWPRRSSSPTWLRSDRCWCCTC